MAPQLLFLWLVPLYAVNEIHQSGVEASGLCEVRAMSGVWYHNLFCAGNPTRKRIISCGDERRFVIADDHQRRHSQISDLIGGWNGNAM
jgi:hypothetical protein